MAFQLGTIDFLVHRLVPRVASRRSVVSLARQRITTHPRAIREYLDRAGFRTEVRGYRWDTPATSRELFLAMGFEHYDDIDIEGEPSTIVHDLNQLVPKELWGRYDLVFELGTMEHVFDVRTVFESMVRLARPGGTVFHFSPVNWVNHGFYNFSFTLFYDVYRYNGFKDIELYLVGFPEDWTKNQNIALTKVDFVPHQVTVATPEGTLAVVACIATKGPEIETFRIPVQAAYDPSLRVDSTLKTWSASPAPAS